MSGSRTHTVHEALKWQAEACATLGSPLTATLLHLAADDWAAGGICREIIPTWTGDPTADGMALRLTGALHYAALTGRADALAGYYPNLGGTFREEGFRDVVSTALRDNRDIVADFMKGPPQTNEVRRSAVLLGGFLTISEATGLPLRCLEIAASAGLNLNWDRFGYTIHDHTGGAQTWGDPASPVQLDSTWYGPAVSLDTTANVLSRAGCDISPVNLDSEETRTRMAAFVWPDQVTRFNNLRAAMDIALSDGPALEKADAAEWARAKLAENHPGTATVIYHSIAQHYFSEETKRGLSDAIHEAGERATDEAPLAWLRMEFESMDSAPLLRLKSWPGGEARVLADVHPHGNLARWRDE